MKQIARQQAEMNRILAARRELPAEYQQVLLDKLEAKETAISIEAEVDEEGTGIRPRCQQRAVVKLAAAVNHDVDAGGHNRCDVVSA